MHAALDGNEKVPGAQAAHKEIDGAPAKGDANPPGHGMHIPSALYFPATHATHPVDVVVPPSGVVSPGGQSVQALAPGVSEYFPFGQNVHSRVSAAPAYLPTAQPEHVAWPVNARVPAGHASHVSALTAPSAPEDRPAGHA